MLKRKRRSLPPLPIASKKLKVNVGIKNQFFSRSCERAIETVLGIKFNMLIVTRGGTVHVTLPIPSHFKRSSLDTVLGMLGTDLKTTALVLDSDKKLNWSFESCINPDASVDTKTRLEQVRKMFPPQELATQSFWARLFSREMPAPCQTIQKDDTLGYYTTHTLEPDHPPFSLLQTTGGDIVIENKNKVFIYI